MPVLHDNEESNVRAQLTRTIPALLALLVLPVAAAAQQPQQTAPVDPSQLPQEAQELIVEIQQVQSNLQQIQQQAMADPEIQAEQQAIGQEIQLAMAESNPDVPQQMQRLETLMTEAQAAQASEDAAKMQEIVAEARELDTRLQAAQAEAIQRPEIAPRVQSFQTKLQEKMLELDPTTPQLIQRLQELDAQLAPFVNGPAAQ